MSTPSPGTWHVANPDVKVDFQVAVDAWGEAAAPILRRVATTYGATISYGDLGEELFELTGYRTTMIVGNWIAKVLGPVQRQVQASGEPPLTSLVVSTHGGVGPGYINQDRPTGFHDDGERQVAAAADRLSCYRAFSEDVPADAAPAMPDHWRPTAQAPRPVKKGIDPSLLPAAPTICPTCFLQVPASGTCTACADA